MDDNSEATGGRPEAPEELVAIFAEARVPWTVRPTASPLWTPSSPVKPGIWSAQSRAVLASVETRDNGTTQLIAPLPPHPFSPAMPVRFEQPHWLATISTHRPGDLGRHTFDIPPIPALTPWASQTLQVIADVRLEADGVAAFEAVDATSITLRLVEERAVIQQMFAHAGLTATLSPAGQAADRIVGQMGGLWSCRDLRLHGLRSLLASGLHAWTWHEATARLHDNGAYSRYGNVPEAADMLRSVIDRRALQAVWSLRCPSCAVRSEYRLDALGDHMTCPRCSQQFDPAPLLEQGTWKYRPSGFFATLSSHGSVPVVLSMIRLLETLHMRRVMVDACHDITCDGWKEEADVVALWRDRAGDPVMAIGECKGGERPLEESDVTSLRRISDAIRASGVECYVVFATTRREFTEDELALFRQLRDEFDQQSSLDGDYQGERLGPVLLAADQLDFHEFAPLSLVDELPARHLLGMAELAQDSLAIHMDPRMAQRFRDGRETRGLHV